MPAVSVVIPAHNAAPWLAETLRSVLDQTYRDLEVIVVNDGSTDDTQDVIASFGQRIYCVEQTNQGLPAARNTGIRSARGDWIALLDADDLWLPDKLERQMELVKNVPTLKWTYCDAYMFDDATGTTTSTLSAGRRLPDGDILRPLFLGNFIGTPTTVIRRDVFDNVGMLDETLVPCGEDWDLWLRIAAHYQVGVVRLPLARYRVRRGSMSSVLNYKVGLQRSLTVIERAAARYPEQLGTLRNQSLANLYIGTGMTLGRSGNLVEARAMFAQAIRLRPSTLQAYLYWLACLSGRPILNAAIRLRHWVRRKRTLGWRA
jgi:glycosyltransferase involved in cell wall biosynthesis